MPNAYTAEKNEKIESDKKRSRLKEILVILYRHDIIHGLTPEKLHRILEDLGPTFVKLGQIMSMRPDILPEEYCAELTKLRMDVRPMPFVDVVAMIEGEYGVALHDVFARFDERPLGSASIAQVHGAVLRDGTHVVVKVQRPGIHAVMMRDIALMRKATGILKLVSHAGDAVDFNAVIEEMWTIAQQEMDFLLEANHAKEFAQRNESIAYVCCPEVDWSHSTSRVLVMEYIDGIRIDQIDALQAKGYDMEEIGLKLAHNYVKQIVDDAFFHADPHPGNIWIRDGKIVWLDLGMMGRLTNRDRQLFKDAVTALGTNDVDGVKTAVLALGVHRGRINHTLLYEDIDDMLTKYGNLDFGSMDSGEVIYDLLDLSNRHAISMPAGVTMLARGILTIEGVLRKCAPNINFLQVMANHALADAFSDIDVAQLTQRGARLLYTSARKTVELPGHLADLLRMMIKGHTKVNLEVIGSEEPMRQMDRITDKLVAGIIIAGLFIGSSLLCTTQMTPKLLGIPLLGALGYFAAFLCSCWLLIGLIKRRRKKR